MTGIQVVMRRYFREFAKDKGKQLLCILPLSAGVVVPFLYKSLNLQALTIIGLSVFYLIQTISGVFAQEKERKTIETLLSTPILIKDLILGATLYNISIIVILVGATVALQAIVNIYFGNAVSLTVPQLILLIAGWLVTLIFVTVYGLLVSMLSDNLPMASQKISATAYAAVFCLGVCITLLEMGYADLYYYLILSYIIALTFVVIYKLCYSIGKITRERVIIGVQHKSKSSLSPKARQNHKEKNFGVFSPVLSILSHERKIARSYQFLWKHFTLMMFLPGIALVVLYSQGAGLDFKLPFMAAILLVTRIPMNLISISIGGEKAFKTFESLLSTPISTRTMFIGKILPSILVSGLILLGSAAGMLLAANLVNIYIIKEYVFIGFSLSEWILLLGDGFLVTILMIFISGYLALMSKTPRAGLWVSVFISVVLAIPHGAILYGVENAAVASVGYFGLLLVINALCFTLALGKVDRRILLSRI